MVVGGKGVQIHTQRADSLGLVAVQCGIPCGIGYMVGRYGVWMAFLLVRSEVVAVTSLNVSEDSEDEED